MLPIRMLPDRFRQPEYVGENRCIPCTVVNLAITVVVSGVAAVVWPPAGVGVFVVGVSSIYLRGYLVPGTPTLTKRYLPDRVLRLFDKHEPGGIAVGESRSVVGDSIADQPAEDPETVLRSAGVVEPCENEDDLCLVPSFRAAWRERIAALRETDMDDHRRELADLLGVEGTIEFHEYDEAVMTKAFVAMVDGTRLGQWESHAALMADLATARELSVCHDGWNDLSIRVRSQVLTGLRIFLETCPVCEGGVSVAEESVESCCRAHDVVVTVCDDCGSRLVEMGQPE